SLDFDASTHAKVGDTFECPITIHSTGQVKGVSLRFSWNAAKVRPVGIVPGEKVIAAGGVVLSPRPGVVDLAFAGAPPFSGEAQPAVVRCTALAAGDPGIKVTSVDGRDAANRKLTLPVEFHAPPLVVPRATFLALAAPNPFTRSTTMAFDLSQRGHVQL